MKRSYNAYLKWRAYWKSKNYTSDPQMSIDEYTEFHIAASLMGGDPNIARTIARKELTYTGEAARELSKIAKKIKVTYEEYDDEYVDIYDVSEQQERRKNEERRMLKEKYKDWRSITSASDREQVFLDLARAEIDVDLWDYDEATRERLYSTSLKRFREQFEADSDPYKPVRRR